MSALPKLESAIQSTLAKHALSDEDLDALRQAFLEFTLQSVVPPRDERDRRSHG